MSFEPVRFWNRYEGCWQQEKVFGQSWLRRVYGTFYGNFLLRPLARSVLWARLMAWWMKRPRSAKNLKNFIATYQIRMEDFVEPAGGFRCFNDFFIRELKPKARDIVGGKDTITFPADGRHRVLQNLGFEAVFGLKGQTLQLRALLGSEAAAAPYLGGSALLSRLCPVDYHRIHLPSDAAGLRVLGDTHGALDSVNPWVLWQRPWILWQNRRVSLQYSSEIFGEVTMVVIGAACVGSIQFHELCFSAEDLSKTPEKAALSELHGVSPSSQTLPRATLPKGESIGYFQFGGSMLLTLFEKGRVSWDEDLLHCSAQQRELYGRMGDHAGSFPQRF